MSQKLLLYLTFVIFVLGLVLTDTTIAQPANLYARWPLNEGEGEMVFDISGNDLHGMIQNADNGLGLDGSVWVEDPVRGTVISFNGTADGAFVRAGDIPQMTLTNDFTWAFWAKHSADNTADNDIILGNELTRHKIDCILVFPIMTRGLASGNFSRARCRIISTSASVIDSRISQ